MGKNSTNGRSGGKVEKIRLVVGSVQRKQADNPPEGATVKTYRLKAEDLETIKNKLVAAQTLLNAHAIADVEERRPPSDARRLEMAEDAEELVHDVADIIFGLQADDDIG